jgi:hypothetical protein
MAYMSGTWWGSDTGYMKALPPQVSSIPLDWDVDRVVSSSRGELPLPDGRDTIFEWSPGERLTFSFAMRPKEGHEWPDSFAAKAYVSESAPPGGWPDGGVHALLAAGTVHLLRNPHPETVKHYTLEFGDKPGWRGDVYINAPDESWRPGPLPGAGTATKNYYEDFPLWIDEGDYLEIQTEGTVEMNVSWRGPPTWPRETWLLPPSGVGSERFVCRGGVNNAVYTYPDDYDSESGGRILWVNHPAPLSAGSAGAVIVSPDGSVDYLLEDRTNPRPAGPLGAGVVGDHFEGEANASGFLRLFYSIPEGGDWAHGLTWDITVTPKSQLAPIPEPITALCFVASVGALAVYCKRRTLGQGHHANRML